MKYEFTNDFLTGIKQIDEEHRRLFEITNEAYELLTNEFIPDKYDHIIKVITDLEEYTKMHFSHEEKYMDSISYMRRFSQKIQHANFIAKIEAVDLKHMDANQRTVLLDLIDFLANWLFSHIKGMDKRIPADN